MAVTVLRARYARALGLSPAAQTRECIEYLENPEILVAEFCDSYLMAEAVEQQDEDFATAESLPAQKRAASGAAVERLRQAPSLQLCGAAGECVGFSYVARDIVPLCTRGHDGAASAGVDYVGLTREAAPAPLLGVVGEAASAAPFAALLRLLACLAEVGSDAQLARANRLLFKGALAERSPFDLHLLWVGEGDPVADQPLVQLTHDLAAVFSAQLGEEWSLPPLIRYILCLRMPAAQEPFDGTLQELWRV